MAISHKRYKIDRTILNQCTNETLSCVWSDALVTNNHDFQDAFCSTLDAVTAMVALYDGCTSRSLLMALTRAVCSVVRDNSVAQKMFVDAGVANYISVLLSLKVRHTSSCFIQIDTRCSLERL